MKEDILEETPVIYCLKVTPKDELEKRRVIELLPHNLHCFDIGLSKMIAKKNDKNQTVYRSKERLRLIELEDNQVLVESEEYSYVLSVCAFLNDFEIKYELDDTFNKYNKEQCLTVNVDNLDELVEMSNCEPHYVAMDLL